MAQQLLHLQAEDLAVLVEKHGYRELAMVIRDKVCRNTLGCEDGGGARSDGKRGESGGREGNCPADGEATTKTYCSRG